MKYPIPSGLTQGLPFLIAADWTPEQAPAVVELLDHLRDRIWSHYQNPLYDLYLTRSSGYRSQTTISCRPQATSRRSETRHPRPKQQRAFQTLCRTH